MINQIHLAIARIHSVLSYTVSVFAATLTAVLIVAAKTAKTHKKTVFPLRKGRLCYPKTPQPLNSLRYFYNYNIKVYIMF